MSDLIVIG
jgi:uncharacterized membrane protein